MKGISKTINALPVLIFFLVFAFIGQAAAQSWTQPAPTGGPPVARMLHTAVYDQTNNRMIMFGGFTGDPDSGFCTSGNTSCRNDVWVLQNADGLGGTPTWTQLSPSGTLPSPRGYHTAVYDSANNRMIVYGGDPNIGFCYGAVNDVWVLSNANGLGGTTPTWTQLSPTGGPPPLRQAPRAVYDPANNRMIVFGGGTNSCATGSNDVWVLSNANGLGGTTPTWTQLSPTGVLPSPRGSHTTVYDPATNKMTVFGGGTTSGVVNDVWVLSNANGLGGTTPTWTQLSPTGGPPLARAGHTAVYEPGANRMVVFGGAISGGSANDVWVLSNANGLDSGTPTWTQLSPSETPPSARVNHTAVLNTASNRMTIYAGVGCVPGNCFDLGDVWVLTDATGSSSATGTGTLQVTVRRSDTSALLAGATVTLNGPSTPAAQTTGSDGTTTFANLQVGSYIVTVSISGFLASSTTATVSATIISSAAFSLTPATGTLTVTTTPVSGAILVDGTRKGYGAITLSLPAGSHTVSFGAVPGFTTPASQTVAVNAEQTTSVTGTYAPTQPGCLPTPITPGSPVSGSLDETDCAAVYRAVPLGHLPPKADRYTFTGSAGQQVSLTMTRQALPDPFLILVGPDQTVVAQDDDSGGFLNAVISPLTLPRSGTYTIEATSAGSTHRGTYTLTLTLTGSSTVGGSTDSWSGWSAVPGGGQSSSQAAAIVDSSGAVRLYIQGMDHRLWVNTKRDSSWSGWSAVPGGVTLSGPAAMLDGGAVRLVVRGLDNGVWTALADAPQWTALGGKTTHAPTAILEGGTLRIFVTGLDGAVYLNSRPSSTDSWSGWSAVPGGGQSSSQAAAIVDSSGAVRLYIQGMDHRLWVNTKRDSSWSGWSAVPGGATLSGPAAMLDGGAVRLVVRGLDNGVWTALADAPQWTALGGKTTHAPTAILEGGTLHIFVTGLDGAVYLNSRTDSDQM